MVSGWECAVGDWLGKDTVAMVTKIFSLLMVVLFCQVLFCLLFFVSVFLFWSVCLLVFFGYFCVCFCLSVFVHYFLSVLFLFLFVIFCVIFCLFLFCFCSLFLVCYFLSVICCYFPRNWASYGRTRCPTTSQRYPRLPAHRGRCWLHLWKGESPLSACLLFLAYNWVHTKCALHTALGKENVLSMRNSITKYSLYKE